MHDLLKLLSRLSRLALQALGQNYRQQAWVGSQRSPDGRKVRSGCTRCNQTITLQYKGIAHQLDQGLMSKWNVA